jgi:hypothetical protein
MHKGYSFLFPLMKKETKKSSLQIKSVKTFLAASFRIPSRSPDGSTRAMLPLRYCGVFYAFYLRAKLSGMVFIFAPLRSAKWNFRKHEICL